MHGAFSFRHWGSAVVERACEACIRSLAPMETQRHQHDTTPADPVPSGQRTPRSRLSRLRSMMSSAATLRPLEWVMVLKVVGLLPVLLLLQRMLPLPRLLALFDASSRSSERAPSGDASAGDPHRLAWLTTGTLRLLLRRDYCMKRSILLFRFLRQRGYPVRIHFGVGRQGASLTGHAWLTLHGKPFAEAVDPSGKFTSAYVYPQSV